MDFSWSENQCERRRKVVEFASNELGADLQRRDRAGEFSLGDWQRCAAFGIQGISVPEEFGGQGADILSAVLTMEGLGYGCRDNGLCFGLNAQMWTVQLPIVIFGDEKQKRKYLPALAGGNLIGAHAVTEENAGSDIYSLTMSAVRRDGGYVLNGRKKYVTLGPIANVALVFAKTGPEMGRWGITAFLVDADTPGYSHGPAEAKMGLRTVPFSDVTLTDCWVPDQQRLGVEGAGVSISSSSLEWERCCILAGQLGAMEYQLETAVTFARKRRQFGQSIGKFQSVSNRIADMKSRLEASRLLVYKAAWLKKSGKQAMMEAALAKLILSESFTESSLDAIRIHGGQGYLTESEVERDLRDAIGGVIYGGTSDIQRNIISKMLGL